jgi:signal transduction histidine kinase/CheY-like chemotaxis protein
MKSLASAPDPKVNKSAAAVALLACLVVALLFALLFFQMRAGEQLALKSQMDTMAAEQVALLRGRLESATQVLDTLVSLWEVDLVSSRQDFAMYAKRELPEHPELLALEWVPRVSVADRTAYVRAARDDGYSDYAFKRFGKDDPDRTESNDVFPVYYVEPIGGNERVLGVDLTSDPPRRAALEAARDSGHPTATGAVRLLQSSGDLGFLIIAPVYCRAASLGTVEGRRRALMGFVAGVFRIDDLVRAAVADLHDNQVAMTIVEPGAASGASRLPHVGDDRQGPSPQVIEVSGRPWTVLFGVSSKAAAGVHSHSYWVIPIGLGGVILFGAYLFAAVRRAVEIERRVRKRTAALNLALKEEIAVRQRAEQDAARANEAKSMFVANVSHEIRTPLNAILGYAQILQADPFLPSQSLGAVRKISTSGAHLLGLINEILDLSRIEAGQAELHCGDFGLRELLTDIGMLFENQCSKAGLEFRLEGLPPHGTRVLGDPGKLRQILINLAGNAVKFTPAGVVRLRLHICDGQRYVFEVTDTGPGIPEAALDDVLLPFHQEPAGRQLGGTGLGLAIAKRYAALMGARLTIQSRVGKGSTFSLSVMLPTANAIPEESPAPRWRLAPGAPVVALVVDDVAENREVLATMLENLGCRVSVAANGRDALERAREIFERDEARGIVFLDVRMPECDGPALVKDLRSGPLGGIRIVAHSASALAHQQAAYKRDGFDDFLAKPVSLEAVRACLLCLPSVAFECDAPAVSHTASDGRSETQTRAALPEALQAQIREAAHIHNATALRACLRELEQLGPPQRVHLERLRHALRSYDMRAIASVLSQEPH